MYDDLAQPRTLRLQFFPEPSRHFFDRWVLQPFDIVEISMVQHFQKRFHRVANFRMVVNPSHIRIDLALDRNFDLETVPMHSPAFVACRRFGQSLGRFKSEIFRQACAHVAENTTTLIALSSRTRGEGPLTRAGSSRKLSCVAHQPTRDPSPSSRLRMTARWRAGFRLPAGSGSR